MVGKKLKQLLAVTTIAVLCFTGCGGNTSQKNDENGTDGGASMANGNVNEYGLSKTIDNGTILHCWCWSFNTIKENMSEIAASGFTSVQTSPISQCLEGENGGMEIYGAGKWYFHYQPTKYVIGNYQLGTEEEFKQMCEEADKYGISVIVDTVINHCTSEYDSIDASLTDIEGGGFHPQDGNWSETDRFEETQYALSGLWDLNTQNTKVQNLVLDFLKNCVADGADGFRYDAAKLIELPDDTSAKYGNEFTSDFWPTVLNNGSKFQYGEVLQEGGNITYSTSFESGYDDSLSSRLEAYQKFMNTTNSMYGFRIREAVDTNNLSVDFIGDNLLPLGASASKVVTWVESHDNYCNDATYTHIDNGEIIRAWAILAARENGTPLFFDRPKGSSATNPWGENVLGAEGSSLYKDAQVRAVNFFRNEMGDAKEYISNPTGSQELLMIERGDKGAVIVNASNKDIVLDNEDVMSMVDGTYKEQVYGTAFVVKDGKISGTVKAGCVAVVYNRESTGATFNAQVESLVSSGYFLEEEISIPVAIRGCKEAYYQINNGTKTDVKDGDIISIGKDFEVGEKINLVITGITIEGKEVKASYEYSKEAYLADTVVYYDSNSDSDWSSGDIYAYIYNDGATKTNGSWPGVKMEDIGNGIYKYVLPYELEGDTSNVIFNNGSGGDGNQYPTAAGLVLDKSQSMILDADGNWEKYSQ